MTRWGEIKCTNCAAFEERLEAAQRDAKEAEAYAEELEAKLFTCATDLDTYMNAHAALEAKLAQQGNLVQAAVAAALREVDKAIQAVADNCTTEDGHLAIVAAVEKVRSFMPQDAQAALDRVVVAERTMRPIGTAPRDGTYILVTPYGDPTDLQVSWFIDGEDRWANWSWSVEPSHWFPLPAICKGGE